MLIRPSLHRGHTPHHHPAPGTTRCPISRGATPGPLATTIPTTSCPRMAGRECPLPGGVLLSGIIGAALYWLASVPHNHPTLPGIAPSPRPTGPGPSTVSILP